MTGMTLIVGNTFPVKDEIKAMGGKWDNEARGWRVPNAVAEEAKALVAAAPRSSGPRADKDTYTKCTVCGTTEGPIYRSGECRGCFDERQMGY